MAPHQAQLAKLDQLRRRREAGEAATRATPAAVRDALAAGITAAEIARRLNVSEGYVRRFRREAGLQDPRYAHLRLPTRDAGAVRRPAPLEALAAATHPAVGEVPDSVRNIPKPRVDLLVKGLEAQHPEWTRTMRRAIRDDPQVPDLWVDYVLLAAAQGRGHLDLDP